MLLGLGVVLYVNIPLFTLPLEPSPAHFPCMTQRSLGAEKRGGAWMDSAVTQSRLLAKGSDALRLPAAYIVCNQSPPVDDQPSLMTFR